MNLLRKLLPTKEEYRKLWFEVIKYLVLLLVASALIFVPVIRESIVSWCKSTWKTLSQEHLFSGWKVFGFGILAIVGVSTLLRHLLILLSPSHTRNFNTADYDGLIWRWSWKKNKIEENSLTPFCRDCDSELILTYDIGHMGRRDVNIFCTTCNAPRRFTNVDDLKRHVTIKIEGDVRTNRWKEKVLKKEKS